MAEAGRDVKEQSNTVKVQFYYTQAFEDVTSDISGHVATLLAGANTVYANSNVSK